MTMIGAKSHKITRWVYAGRTSPPSRCL